MTLRESDLAGLGRLAKGMLGAEISFGYARPEDGSALDLLPEELAGTVGMTPKRLREFAAGRAAVRMAALSRGVAPFAVPMGADRAPVWPDGVIGSIAHTGDACVAVLGHGKRLVSVGIDLETDAPLSTPVTDAILCDADRAGNRDARQMLGDRYGLVVFAAKEAAYKCQYPITRSLIDFDALSIRLSPGTNGFAACFERRVGALPAGLTVNGRYAFASGHVLTAASFTTAQWAIIANQTVDAGHG